MVFVLALSAPAVAKDCTVWACVDDVCDNKDTRERVIRMVLDMKTVPRYAAEGCFDENTYVSPIEFAEAVLRFICNRKEKVDGQ
jgi:hypothetical protein